MKRGFRPNILVPEYQKASYNVDDNGMRFVRDNISIDKSGVKYDGDEDMAPKSDIKLEECEILDLLGEGNSSVVHRARHRPTGKMMAIKRISIYDKDKRRQLIKELDTLYRADCRYLIAFYGAFFRDGSISVAIELMDAGSVHDVLRKAQAFPEDIIAWYAVQILQGLEYLRGQHQIHRDIKPANICLNTKGEAKLTDFGISKQIDNTMGAAESFVGTSAYMSPERIMGQKYSYSSDIWSIGLCFLECFLGKFPYPLTNVYVEHMQAVVHGDPPEAPPEAGASTEFKAFIATCLRKDPAARPEAHELLKHPFLTKSRHVNAQVASQWINGVLARPQPGAT